MSLFYCADCTAKRGLRPTYDVADLNLTGNAALLDKFFKHTATGYWQGGQVSIFQSGDYASYQSYVVNTLYSGYYERDSRNRESLVFLAGSNQGFQFDPVTNTVLWPENAIRLVCYHDTGRIHPYSQDAAKIAQGQCADCGKALPC